MVDLLRKKGSGVAIEDLVREFGVSMLVAKYKIETYLNQGKIVSDSSVEGVKYYLNDIITCTFD